MPEVEVFEKKKEAPKEIKTVLVWKSPSRPFRKAGREMFTTIGAMVFLVALILLFAKEILLIGVILAMFFVYYVLNTVPPEDVEHRIMTNGVESAGHAYTFDELRDFWFVEKYGHKVLCISTKLKFPGRLIILLSGESEAKIKELLLRDLTFREKPVKTWMDNASDWLGRHVRLEKTS